MPFPGIPFTCRDPRGKKVACGHGSWAHICKQHPDIAYYAALVQQAIVDPHEIYADADIFDNECYYRFGMTLFEQPCTFKVVVHFGSFSNMLGGQVTTAYPLYHVVPGQVKKKERKLWTSGRVPT